MDELGEIYGSDAWREVISYWQAKRVDIQDSLGELHKSMDRVYTMLPEYGELIECAHWNIQDAQSLESEINTFATRLGVLPMPRQNPDWATNKRRMSLNHKLGRIGMRK